MRTDAFKKNFVFHRTPWVRMTVVASSKRWPWPSSTRYLRGFLISSRSHPLPEIAHVCARVYWKIRRRGRSTSVSSFGTVQRYRIKGKCRDRDSLVTSRGARNFSFLGTYELTIMPDAVSPCMAGMRCIYYVSDAGPVRAYAIGDGCISAPAIAHLYARSTPVPAVRTSCVSLHCAES